MNDQPKSRSRRTLEHLAAGFTFSAPMNFATVFALSSVVSNPATLAVTTTLLATAISGIRTYVVLTWHER